MARSLGEELKKRKPFDSVEQEATLAILRTGDLLENRLARLLRDYDLTMSQYNVLRILRGEGAPLPSLEVASRMIQVAPPITRIVEQLLSRNLIVKKQDKQDRRVFTIDLTRRASKLLESIDEPILQLHRELLRSVTKKQQQVLIDTLASIRSSVEPS